MRRSSVQYLFAAALALVLLLECAPKTSQAGSNSAPADVVGGISVVKPAIGSILDETARGPSPAASQQSNGVANVTFADCSRDIGRRSVYTTFLVPADRIETQSQFTDEQTIMRYSLETLEPRRLLSALSPAARFGPSVPSLSVISMPGDDPAPVSPVAPVINFDPIVGPYLPIAPSNLTAETMSSSEITLNWSNDPASNASSIQVLRSTDGVNFSVVATLDPTATTFDDNTLIQATQYSYMLAAVNSAGNSANSGITPATTAPLILPGSGFSGPTLADPNIQQVNPKQMGYNDLAIARWDVVPNQTFSGLFNVGVVAFHMNGIKEVDFSVNGGAVVKVTQMTLNPQTANNSGVGNANPGVVEYWATLDASKFASDGQIEVRAVAYPNNGQAKVLTPLTLFTNAHQTLASNTLYVKPSTGSDSNPGTAGEPFATLIKALSAATDGTTIILDEAGRYDGNRYAGALANNVINTRWITVEPAAVLAPGSVVITGDAGPRAKLATRAAYVHWLSVSLDWSTFLYFQPYTASWFDQTTIYDSNGIWPADGNDLDPYHGISYATNSVAKNMAYGFVSCAMVRGCAVSQTIDAFQNSQFVLNSADVSQNIPAADAIIQHPDVFQIWGNQDNLIIYNDTAANMLNTQGIFVCCASQPGDAMTNSAFVNLSFNSVQTTTNPFSQLQGTLSNVLFQNISLSNQGLLLRTDFTNLNHFSPTDVVLRNVQVPSSTYKLCERRLKSGAGGGAGGRLKNVAPMTFAS
jgi:hypothetical protein